MPYLTECHKIKILMTIENEDRRTRTHNEAVFLLREIYPDLSPKSQGTVCTIEKMFRENGYVRKPSNPRRNMLHEDVKVMYYYLFKKIEILPPSSSLNSQNAKVSSLETNDSPRIDWGWSW